MKKTIVLLIAYSLLCTSVLPCTTFVLKTNNAVYFGRNLDWASDHGIILVNQRDKQKSSFVFGAEKPIAWTSKYGSVSFNQFGKEFPFGGINEKGLVIEIMISQAEYPHPDGRPMVNELQWVQYQLDNCSSIDEVIATDSILRIGQATEMLHFLLCDAQGNTAVIEFINGKMKAYRNEDLPVSVLANDPYMSSMKSFKKKETCRFTTAANMVERYNGVKPAVEYSFQILQEVALTAEWSVVYDITKRQIHFRTSSHNAIRVVDMDRFNFGCDNPCLSYDLADNDHGNISDLFIKLNVAKNTEILEKALEISMPTLLKNEKNEVIDYFENAKCEK